MKLRLRRPSPEQLLAEMAEHLAEARRSGDREAAERLLAARHRAGLALVERASAPAPWPEPDAGALSPLVPPETSPDALTPALLRAALLRNGCLIVRGAVARATVETLRAAMDAAYAGRTGAGDAYVRFVPDARYDLAAERDFVGAEGWGGLWAADAPQAALAVFDAFDRAGLLSLAEGYLGERPAVSVNKCLLRKMPPPREEASASAWHQDGAFLGDVRALNVWLAVSRAGDVAPGMDVVPRRLDLVPTGTEGAIFPWSVSQAVAEEAAGEVGIVRPVFAPGDVLLFDERFLHATAAEPGMTEVRYAIECWFFGPSAFPAGYAPLAV